MRFPEGAAPYRVTVGADIALAEGANLPAAIARMEAALSPAEPVQVEDWLVMLQVACSGARKSEAEGLVALMMYAQTLLQYPADVAREVCKILALRPRKGGNWFPTLAEVNAECERLTSPRLSVLAALRSWQPQDAAALRQAEVRDLMLQAHELRTEALRCKRSNPERYADLMAQVRERDTQAGRLRRGEVEPAPLR